MVYDLKTKVNNPKNQDYTDRAMIMLQGLGKLQRSEIFVATGVPHPSPELRRSEIFITVS